MKFHEIKINILSFEKNLKLYPKRSIVK